MESAPNLRLICIVTFGDLSERASPPRFLLLKQLERGEAIGRLERADPHDERSAAVEQFEHLNYQLRELL